MPSFDTRDIERCLLTKLRAVERRAGDHRVFAIVDDEGDLVATTGLSRSWLGTTSIGPAMVAAIRREIGLQAHPRAFIRLIGCPLRREAYLALVVDPSAEE